MCQLHAEVIRLLISASSFNEGVKIVPRYLNLLQYPKNSWSFKYISAVSASVAFFPAAGMNIASVFESAPVRLSPQCNVRPNRAK